MYCLDLGAKDKNTGRSEFTVRFSSRDDIEVFHFEERLDLRHPFYNLVYEASKEIIRQMNEIGDIRRALSTCFDRNNFLEIKEKHNLDILKKLEE